MRGSAKGAKEPEEYEDIFLHQTIGGSRIRSYSQRHGQHRLIRHHHPSIANAGTTPASYISQTSSAGAAGATASSVSSYLENLPSITLDNSAPPPRPPRPPGGLLGISNGRGMGYGRSLGSSYDSPQATHGSFNGHVRSGANLYGAKNPSSSSGLSPSKLSSGGHHRPSMSVFPIQKALEIAMKESRLLAAASSRGGSGTSGTVPLWSSNSSINASGSSQSNSAVHAVRELLDSYPAPSPYCVDDKKRSPLHFAAASGDLELVEFLLERGVRPDCGRDIAGNMPLHLAIISNRIDVVAALLKAGADMTLASPMTHKTPLDLAESRLSYLLSRAQDTVKYSTGSMDLHTSHSNNQIATRSSFHLPPTQSPALLYQIKGIVSLLRPYVVRQQRLQHGERQKERQKERSWDRADKYMRQQHLQNGGSGGSNGLWHTDPYSEAHYGDMEDDDDEDDDDDDEDDDMDTGEGQRRPQRKKLPLFHHDGGMDEDDLPAYSAKPKKQGRRLNRRMDADETEVALESLMNGLSLLEATRKQQEQRQQLIQDSTSGSGGQSLGSTSGLGGVSEIGDGNLADSELDPRSEQDVDDALPDLLEQVQQVLQAIKLNENKGT
ncbi:MAG: hypothetical protein J3R72DRAFT_69239 [Linnemannia gamsii]|nr:MAG: hypothetical protein J3R72DRAFT_69239 [Linnemannia gamsii]